MRISHPLRIALSILACVVACARLSAGERPLYALIGAFPPEVQALIHEFGAAETNPAFTRTTVHGTIFIRGTVDGRDVIIFQAGSSLVNAAYQLQLALERFPITHVLFAGIAGGIDPALHVGDIVVPERWTYHSEAAYLHEDGKGGYLTPAWWGKNKLENFGMIFPNSARAVRDGQTTPQTIEAFPADPALLAAARTALAKLPLQTVAGRTIERSVGGIGVSGSVFLDNASYREWVFRVWHARCLDMESTAYAHVCWANGKPVLIVRGLSDLAGGGHSTENAQPKDLREVFSTTAHLLHAVLDELPR